MGSRSTTWWSTPPVASEASVGAQGQALDGSLVGVLETVVRCEVGERDTADSSALERDDQAVAFGVGHEPADAPLESDLPFHVTGVEVAEEYRVTAVGDQPATAIKKVD